VERTERNCIIMAVGLNQERIKRSKNVLLVNLREGLEYVKG
jgi:hypothetical protein